MPNWCANELTIVFDNDDKLNDFLSKYFENIETDMSESYRFKFNELIPVEGLVVTHVNIVRAHSWGTKWEPYVCITQQEGGILSMTFDSAWSPPTGVYRFLWSNQELFGIDNINASWAEGGCWFCGTFIDGDETDLDDGTSEFKELMESYGI